MSVTKRLEEQDREERNGAYVQSEPAYCHDCGARLIWYDEERYCLDCEEYRW